MEAEIVSRCAPDPCAVALSRVQHQLDQALPAFIRQVLSQAAFELPSAPPRTVRKTAFRFSVSGILAARERSRHSCRFPTRKVSRLRSIATTVGGSFDHKQVELKGIKPVLLLGVAIRSAGEFWGWAATAVVRSVPDC